MRKTKGVSAILYVQTCAAEKRRRRKRGTLPEPQERIFINPDICEGCGDCGVQSNCVSILPLETELGRKREIDQSNCNKDYACVQGFCPSFVTVKGGALRKPETVSIDTEGLAEPALPSIDGTRNIVITGVGGTGVVTIGAVLAMAAHVDGKGAAMMEMAGLAQKGGAVHIHCRLANRPEDISAIRVATGEADTVIGGDLVVTGGAKTIGLMTKGRTRAVVNRHEVMTGAFTRDTGFRIPGERLALSLEARLGDGLTLMDANAVALRTMGDTIFANMILFGAAWQLGQVPISRAAIQEAIRLNGASAEQNLRAFEVGRWVAAEPARADDLASGGVVDKPRTLDERIRYREAHLVDYQSERLARKYRKLVDRVADPRLKEAVALGYHKLLSYKDEYEVARLLSKTASQVSDVFDGDYRLDYHLAPPILSRRVPDGRPAKRVFSQRFERWWPRLAKLKRLRGTPFDPFGYTAERKAERKMIRTYETDMAEILADPSRNPEAAVALAELPLTVRGFGPVKEAAANKATETREALLAEFRAGLPDKETRIAS